MPPRPPLTYQARYPFLNPPWEPTHNDLRFKTVKDKLGNERARAIFVRVKQDFKREPNWCKTAECPICFGTKLHSPSIVLLCNCRHKLYHLRCIEGWHTARGLGKELSCPMCRQDTVPMHVDWVQMPPQQKILNTRTKLVKQRGRRRKNRQQEHAVVQLANKKAKKVNENAQVVNGSLDRPIIIH
ncbi:hypothetical protein B0H12DRAFT_1103735 [Mycena haematopus]|nr:hypothetical protein B0H12DRAFT_1103735 [Mycena haematopus]